MIKYYPTIKHEKAAKKFLEIFSKDKRVFVILLICSCARGKAVKDSCLDLAIITKNVKDKKGLKKKLEKLKKTTKEFIEIKKVGKFSHINLKITNGKIKPEGREWTSGPDEFELEIGNFFIYSVVLFERNDYFQKLKRKYLPYYDEKLRKKRLEEVKKYLFNNLEHIPLYIHRGLYFQAFDRLYKANQEFMQGLFIVKKIYPIAYDKWIKEQFFGILKMPELYNVVLENVSIKNFESNEIAIKAEKLKELAKKYLK